MKTLFLYGLLAICSQVYSQSQQQFPTDAKIERLKSFWITIFTKYNDDYTLIHDSEDTDLVYEIVEHKGMEHFQRQKKIQRTIKKTQKELSSIIRKNFKKLNSEETALLAKIPETNRNQKSLRTLVTSIRGQQGMSNRFKDGLVRSTRFLKQIKEILLKYDMPEELAYLPHVESSFNYFATSKVGAAGIWQLMPRTAMAYKLKINKSMDERLDPLKSSEVAIKLLRDNYRIVKSWPLSITAYNHGTKNIRKTILHLKSYDPLLVLDSINKQSFQFASKNFYPSYLAAVEISQNKKLYFPELKDEENHNFQELIIGKRLSISKISKKVGLSIEEIRQFNPQIVGVSWKKDFSLPQGSVIKYPKGNLAEDDHLLLIANKKIRNHFMEVKQWFDELCGRASKSIASILE